MVKRVVVDPAGGFDIRSDNPAEAGGGSTRRPRGSSAGSSGLADRSVDPQPRRARSRSQTISAAAIPSAVPARTPIVGWPSTTPTIAPTMIAPAMRKPPALGEEWAQPCHPMPPRRRSRQWARGSCESRAAARFHALFKQLPWAFLGLRATGRCIGRVGALAPRVSSRYSHVMSSGSTPRCAWRLATAIVMSFGFGFAARAQAPEDVAPPPTQPRAGRRQHRAATRSIPPRRWRRCPISASIGRTLPDADASRTAKQAAAENRKERYDIVLNGLEKVDDRRGPQSLQRCLDAVQGRGMTRPMPPRSTCARARMPTLAGRYPPRRGLLRCRSHAAGAAHRRHRPAARRAHGIGRASAIASPASP